MDLALAGIGKIALDQHLPAIAASPDWNLAVTVSRRGAVPGVRSYDDFELMLADRPDIRVVSLCMPPAPRFAYARAALATGRHVMLEKPPGATLSECQTLLELARRRRVTLYASWHSREAAKVAAARDWLADRRLKSLHIIWKEDVRRWHPGQDWIWRPGGMGVFDPGINALSIMTAILPDPVHVKAATLEVPENCQTPIAATLAFHHQGGAEVTAVFDFREEGEQIWTIEAETDQGAMQLRQGGAEMLVDGKDVGAAEEETLASEYPRLYANLAHLVKHGDIDMDLAPLRHVADAFTLGRRVTVAPFEEQTPNAAV